MGNVEYAYGNRIAAFLIDNLLIGLIGLLAMFIGLPSPSDSTILGLVVLAYWIVPEAVYGQTPGKKRMGVKIINKNGSPPGVLRAIVRTVLRVVDQFLFYSLPGLWVIAVTEKNQRIGDLAAGTYVIEDKSENTPG